MDEEFAQEQFRKYLKKVEEISDLKNYIKKLKNTITVLEEENTELRKENKKMGKEIEEWMKISPNCHADPDRKNE